MVDQIAFTIGLYGSVIGVIGTIIGVCYWLFFDPQIFFRIAGEQKGEPIIVLPVCRIPFAVSTNSFSRVILLSVSVCFNDDLVTLFSTKGIQKQLTVDREFPMEILFQEEKHVIRKTLQANYFDVQAQRDSFSIKFKTVAEVDHAKLPFLFSILPVRRVEAEWVVSFEVDPNVKMTEQTHGLMIKPGEAIQIAGEQSQERVTAATDKGVGTLRVREIVDSSKPDEEHR